MAEETFPIEIQSRVIECRTEHERTMLTEAQGVCCDWRRSERHSADHLRAMSKACYDYGLDKMGGFVAAQVGRSST